MSGPLEDRGKRIRRRGRSVPMKKMTSRVILLLVLSGIASSGFGQARKSPLTKEEIIRLLRTETRGRLGQANIASEVAERGVAFLVDEPTLEELRRAGAHSLLLEEIRRAGETRAPPRPPGTGAEVASEEAEQPRAEPLPLLEQARYHALQFVDELPNFTVTQLVSRYSQGRGQQKWQLEDTLEVELSYSLEKGERFRLLRLNGASSRKTYEQLGGSTSTGEFGSMLGGLFAPQSQAEFREIRSESFRGRNTSVFDFKVKTANSTSELTDRASGRTIISGYEGSVWIDIETKRVLRLEQSMNDIPSGFPVTLSENAVEYDWVRIGEKRYLMPVHAEVLMGGERDRYYTRNVIEMRNYHKFEADVKILP